MLDVEGLLQPVSPAAPSGPERTYEEDYRQLDRALEGKPERQVGGTIAPAEPPEWRDVLAKSQALLKTTKDLHVAVVVTRALLEVQGFAGFADGLVLLRGLIERFWADLHPHLDAEDNNDPTARVTAMGELTHRNVIQAVRSAPLAVSQSFGTVSYRTIQVAASPPPAAKPASPPKPGGPAAPPPGPPPPTAAAVEAAFQQAGAESLGATEQALGRCVAEAKALSEQWGTLLPSAGPDFTELRTALYQCHQAVKTRLGQQIAAGAGTPASGEVPGQAAATSAAAAQPIRGTVGSREDVVRAIDAICAYYAAHEPSSPVPLLLQRGKRLATMSFMDILKDIVPESVANVQKITGKTDG
jgi:type VI secretion system protein ImpA